MIDINYIKLPENKGSGYARQYALCNTSCKYVSFIDSDDQLYNPYSLYLMHIKITESNDIDFVTGGFIQEHDSCGHNTIPLSKVSKNNQTWVWGRLFSRDFLSSNNISFSDLRYNEDVLFMELCFAFSKRNEFIKNTIYIWHYNETSLTRSPDGFLKKKSNGLVNFVDALSLSHIKKRELGIAKNEKSFEQACDGLCMCYWYFIKIYNEDRNECERFLKAYQKFYNLVTEDFGSITATEQIKKSYFASTGTATEVSETIVPQFTLWEVLSDLEDNKNEVEFDENCKYQFG